ncbi:MAG TPA: VWA domain-containing protein [Candidatus Binataceae bacterium]|nr:VWA domain-containing protein [Candidatus Binataceae bacterium]
MCRSRRRRFGIRELFLFPAALVALLLPLSSIETAAQQSASGSVLQTPQVFSFVTVPTLNLPAPTAQIDPRPMLRIPVTVIDDAGKYVRSLDARDFSLSVDGDESPIALFRPASSAALGILVDISQSMEFKSFSGRTFSKLPMIQAAARSIIDQLESHDSVFLATFARRFHMIDGYTSDHARLDERIPELRVTDQLDDFDGSGICESMMKAVTVLSHAPESCARKALLVFTDGDYDTSSHGAEDVIAKAQFAGVTIYNIVIRGFRIEADAYTIRLGPDRIASETGGLTFVVNWLDGDQIASATDSIAADVDNQYLLGFDVSPWSPGLLSVELMLHNHPGMHTRAPRVVRFRPQDLANDLPPPLRILPE